jgi:hypothetical protein
MSAVVHLAAVRAAASAPWFVAARARDAAMAGATVDEVRTLVTDAWFERAQRRSLIAGY